MAERAKETRRVRASRRALASALLLCVVGGSALIALGQGALTIRDHEVEYLGRVANGDGTSTWTYRVTSGPKPAISHWVLEFDPALDAENVVDASELYEVGTDPTTGLYGLKFDRGYCSGDDDDDDDDDKDRRGKTDDDDDDGGCETRVVTFTLDRAYEPSSTRVAIKAGRDVEVDGPIPGPSADSTSENGDPVAVDDLVSTSVGKQIRISVLENDSDPDGDSLTVESITQPSNGKAKKNGKKKVRYTPNKGFNGIDTFTYTISDGSGGTATATITVQVGSLNSPPVAEDDEAIVQENGSVVVDVLGNDHDNDGTIDPTTVEVTKGPKYGTFSVDPKTGAVTYAPDPGSCKGDYLRYTVADDDGAISEEAKVSFTAVCNEAPTAVDDEATTDEGVAISIDVTANDIDVDGSIDPTTVDITKDPKHGEASLDPTSGIVSYAPETAWCGDDSFEYTVEDDDGEPSRKARVNIEVICNEAPQTRDDKATTDENTSVAIDILANDTDADGSIDPATVHVVEAPDAGSVAVHPTTGVVTYTPDPGSCGEDVFEYTVADNDGEVSDEAAVIVDVLCNDPPLAIDDLYNGNEGEELVIDAPGILANDVDAPGTTLTVVLVADVSHGTLFLDEDGSFTYVHDGSETTSDEFTYVANDGAKDSNVATVRLIVAPTNDPPTAEDDEGVTEEDTPIVLDILANDSDPDCDVLTIDWASPPEHGTVANNGSNILYTPNPDFHGSDAFAYRVVDGCGGSDTAQVTVTVEPINDPPIAEDDSAATAEDTSVAIPVLLNDDDPDFDSLNLVSVTQPANGWAEIEGASLRYTPDADFYGIDTFTYTISDGNGGTSTAQVTVTIGAVNDPPIADPDAATTDEDTPVTIDVLANDEDPEDDPLSVESVTQGIHGTVTNNGSSVVYSPNPDFHGTDAFTYTISDGNGGTDTATVTVTIDPINDPPIAQVDSATTDEDAPVTIDVLGNDEDPEDDSLAVQSITQGTHGTVMNNASNVVYSPNPDFHGSDTFSYTVTDGNGGTDTATVTVTVDPINDPPIADPDSAATDEDTPVTIGVLGNDEDPEGDPLSVLSVTQGAHGTVAMDGPNVVYTPNLDFHGSDSFSYTVTDGKGGTDDAVVTVTVDPVNDPPVAQDDSAGTDEDTAVTVDVLANDEDPEDDRLSVQSITQGANGSVTTDGTDVTYTPDPGFNGSDEFGYTASDGKGGTSTAQVTVTIGAVNDPPIADPDAATTDEDTPVTIDVLGNDDDPDEDPLSVQSVTQGTHGSVTSNGSNVVYAPNADFHGSDTFSYTVTDGNGGTDDAVVTVTVDPINDPPIAQADSAGTDEDTPVTVDVLANDEDPEDDPLSVQSITQGSNGSVTTDGTNVLYSPDPGFNGSDAFSYTMTDGNGGTSTAQVTVTIGAVNDPPIADPDDATTDEDTPVTIDVLTNDDDPDEDPLSVQSVTQGTHGTVTNNGSSVLYTPNADFHGSDTFSYTVTDGNGGTDDAVVTVTINPVNDPPVAQADSDGTDEDTPVTIDVLANDTDPEGDPLSVQSVTQGASGSVTTDGTNVRYTPNPGFTGSDTFTVTIQDGQGGTDSAAVTVFVAVVNEGPIAVDDSAETVEDTPVAVTVLTNDSDPDGDRIEVQSVASPVHGTVVQNSTSVVYTPSPGYFGIDTFTYTIVDTIGATATATVIVTVIGENDAPIALDDSQETLEDTPVSIPVLSNDRDPDNDPLGVESILQPSNGFAVVDGAGILYTPDPGFSGVDAFTYTVSDGQGGSDTARVTVTVDTRNDPPVAQDDSAETGAGSLVSIAVLENDSDPDGDFLIVEAISSPSSGTVLNARTGISYIPADGFQGVDRFTYTVSDGNGGSSTAAVTVSVASENLPPIADDDSENTLEGFAVVIPVLLNDGDPDGDPIVVESVGRPERGEAFNLGEAIEYVPDPEFSGVDQFTYTVSDGNGGTDTALVFVAVAAVNDAPVAQDDSISTGRGAPVTIAVLANDTDPDGDRLTVDSASTPRHGQLRIEDDRIVYTPEAGFSGSDTFTYDVSDGHGDSDSATVTVGVLAGGAGGETAAAYHATSCEGRVIISEIAWAGTSADPRDEWIELRNLGTSPVDLTGWTLQWRPTHPTTAADRLWKQVQLQGTLPASGLASCAELVDVAPTVRFDRAADGVAWKISGDVDTVDEGFFTLERRHDVTIAESKADLVYDEGPVLSLDLSDEGEILMLINAAGEIVDTANATSLGRSGWVAGSASTFGTMERVDPLGPDVTENWHTNPGVVIRGNDADGRPLRATPGAANSPVLEDLEAYANLEPATVQAGALPHVSFTLTREDRRTGGWPWISVSRPGFAGQGGASSMTEYSFAGRYESGETYVLEVGTESLAPGTYFFWVIYGEGEALLIPITVAP